MKYDPDLIRRLRVRLPDTKIGNAEFERLQVEFEQATKLSRGPDPERSAHWERIARHLRSHIEQRARGEAVEYRTTCGGK